MSWNQWIPCDLEAIKSQREQIHQVIQSVSAVGRHFLEPKSDDKNATLTWVPEQGRLAGQWIEAPAGKFRASFSIAEASIHLIDQNINIIDTLEINEKRFPQLMIWFEENIGKLGLPVENFDGDFPYEMPEYPTQKNKPFDFADKTSLAALSAYYHNTFKVLSRFSGKYEHASKVIVWPHHFDQALSIKLKDSGDPATSHYVGLGMSPGDEHYNQPYMYVNSWPYVEEQFLKELTFGNWHSDEWVGGVLLAEELWSAENQEEALKLFYEEASKLLIGALLN